MQNAKNKVIVIVWYIMDSYRHIKLQKKYIEYRMHA